MSRNRPLKVYVSSTYMGPEILEALNRAYKGNDRQCNLFVAARSLKEAAALMATSVGSSDRVGGASLYHAMRDEVVKVVMAKPGQVFATKYDLRSDERPIVEIGVSLEHPNRLVLGQQSDLALGEALLAQAEAKRLAAKEADEQRARERAERRDRRAQTSRVIEETLERIRPKLEALGINPQTVVAGEGAGPKNYDRQGILLPAEAAEQIVKMAIELEEVMGT